MAFCSNCGNELKEGAKFCHKCGTKIYVVPAPVEYNNSSDDDDDDEIEYEDLSLGWKICILLIWPCGLGFYFYYHRKNEPIKAHSAIVWAAAGFVLVIILNFIFFNS